MERLSVSCSKCSWYPGCRFSQISKYKYEIPVKYQNTTYTVIQPKYQNTAHFGEFSKIFKMLVQKFCAISEVLRRFLLFFLVELEKCWKMTPWSSKSASIQPIFCYFEPKFYFDILTIFWYFGALPDWNQSPNILTWKSALRVPWRGIDKKRMIRKECWKTEKKHLAQVLRNHRLIWRISS